jgi:hypothetical protein
VRLLSGELKSLVLPFGHVSYNRSLIALLTVRVAYTESRAIAAILTSTESDSRFTFGDKWVPQTTQTILKSLSSGKMTLPSTIYSRRASFHGAHADQPFGI